MSSESATGLGDIDQRGCSSVMNGQCQPEGDSADSDSEQRMRSKTASIAYRKKLPDDGREALQQDKAFIDMLSYRKQRLCHYAAADMVIFFAFRAFQHSRHRHALCQITCRTACVLIARGAGSVFFGMWRWESDSERLVHSPVLCARRYPGFFEASSIRRINKRVKGNR